MIVTTEANRIRVRLADLKLDLETSIRQLVDHQYGGPIRELQEECGAIGHVWRLAGITAAGKRLRACTRCGVPKPVPPDRRSR